MLRSLRAAVALVGVCGALAFALEPAHDKTRPAPSPTPRVLPGILAGGDVRLPNGWSLRPAGKQVALGDFPVNIALHPDGKWARRPPRRLRRTRDRHRRPGRRQAPTSSAASASIRRFTGSASPPTARPCTPAAASSRSSTPSPSTTACCPTTAKSPWPPAPDKFVVAGVAVDAAGKTLFAAGAWGDAVAVVPLDDPARPPHRFARQGQLSLRLSARPEGRASCSSACGARPASPSSTWRRRRSSATWPTESHPTEMALSPDGKTLYVACANSTKVSVLDTAERQEAGDAALLPVPRRPVGQHAQQPRA